MVTVVVMVVALVVVDARSDIEDGQVVTTAEVGSQFSPRNPCNTSDIW